MPSRGWCVRFACCALLLALMSAGAAWAGEGEPSPPGAVPGLTAPSLSFLEVDPAAGCLATTARSGSAEDLALFVPKPVPACSGDDCGCFDVPCTDQCSIGDQDCLSPCRRAQKRCALACCSPSGGGSGCDCGSGGYCPVWCFCCG